MKHRIHRIAHISLFAALIAVCAQMCLPFVVPFTMQTFALLMALMLLKNDAIVSILVYITLGAVGVPVFAGFKGGAAVLAGPTGGYIFGFLLSALIYMLVIKSCGDKSTSRIFGCIAALLTCYLVGAIWYGVVCETDILTSLAVGVLPYLLPDTAKLMLAFWLSKRLSLGDRTIKSKYAK